MKATSTMKKSISIAAVLAASTALAAARPTTHAEALAQLTGPNQAESGEESSICVSVTPYFITSMIPTGVASSFFSLQIDGVAQFAAQKGNCQLPDHKTGKCERGYVKVTSTAPLACNVPIGL